jgi:crotonobetainyl-CoA:carnitine CoA-transferase CaiB-like acyl-CoA transferase
VSLWQRSPLAQSPSVAQYLRQAVPCVEIPTHPDPAAHDIAVVQASPIAPPPELGQHTNEVLKEFGFKPKEIAALRKANAL